MKTIREHSLAPAEAALWWPGQADHVLVQPGELVFADFDGVVVVPRALENEVLACAHEKVTKEISPLSL